MSNEDYSDLTTDAVPNPNNPTSPKTLTGNSLDDHEDETKDYDQEVDEEVHTTNIKKSQFKGFLKNKKCRVPTAQATIININNSNGIQVGDQYVYNVNNKSEKPLKKVKETCAIRELKKCQTLLVRDDLLFIATHMNELWKDTIRELHYSDGQIEQFVIDHHLLGTKEVIFQLLLSWTQNEPAEASFGNLCTVLWNNNQQDVVKRLSERKK